MKPLPLPLRPVHSRRTIRGQQYSRHYALQTPGAPMLQVFNSNTKYLQKERAASNPEASRKVDYLRDEVATRLCDRLLDIKRHFPHVLDLGANACNVARILTQPPTTPLPDTPSGAPPPQPSEPLAARLSHLTCAETSPTLLHRDAELAFNDLVPMTRQPLSLEQETQLPFPDGTFSAVLSSLSMHWTNDLPSLLRQANRVLVPDGPFLAAMFGGDSLFELRTSLQLASLERRGGIAPHTSPLADVRDVGGLLTRAGFKMLTVDVDDIVVEYPSVFALMMDLQAMGEGNALLGREMGAIGRDVLMAVDGIYRELHGEGENATKEGAVPATFRVIYMIGWKEGEGQSQPLARGSGEINIKDVLGGGDVG